MICSTHAAGRLRGRAGVRGALCDRETNNGGRPARRRGGRARHSARAAKRGGVGADRDARIGLVLRTAVFLAGARCCILAVLTANLRLSAESAASRFTCISPALARGRRHEGMRRRRIAACAAWRCGIAASATSRKALVAARTRPIAGRRGLRRRAGGSVGVARSGAGKPNETRRL
jgi:hypothetical protein